MSRDYLVAIRERKSEELADKLAIAFLDRMPLSVRDEINLITLARFRDDARRFVSDAIGESFEQAGDHMLHDAIADTSMAGIATRLAKLLHEREVAPPPPPPPWP